jgi:rod shape-determining protein MreC
VRSTPRLLAVLLLASFTLTVLDTRADDGSPFDPLRTGTEAVLGPIDRGVGRAAGAVGDLASAATDLADRDELQRLREDNERLRRELVAGEAARRELAEWRGLLALPATVDLDVVPARVTSAGSALGFERTVTVDVGGGDGVAVGQTVLAGTGLVGRTVRVGRWTSVVLLLDDPGFGVGARLAGTGALGLARGEGRQRVSWVQVDPGPVTEGEALLTTGSDTFVPDVPVGRVSAVRTERGGLATTATVEPFADLGRLDLVGVVVGPSRAQPRTPLSSPS